MGQLTAKVFQIKKENIKEINTFLENKDNLTMSGMFGNDEKGQLYVFLKFIKREDK